MASSSSSPWSSSPSSSSPLENVSKYQKTKDRLCQMPHNMLTCEQSVLSCSACAAHPGNMFSLSMAGLPFNTLSPPVDMTDLYVTSECGSARCLDHTNNRMQSCGSCYMDCEACGNIIKADKLTRSAPIHVTCGPCCFQGFQKYTNFEVLRDEKESNQVILADQSARHIIFNIGPVLDLIEDYLTTRGSWLAVGFPSHLDATLIQQMVDRFYKEITDKDAEQTPGMKKRRRF
jgi:hypothetical protein